MSNQPGLSDHKRYEAFTGKWRSSHVVKELEIPDEEEDGRSVLLSFLNTVLFVLTAGAFGFCFYETGFLQYLMQ